ncbi:MAG TPA: DUF1351 domain-containing protein, partial [Acidobacteriaceae bacterium]
ETAQALAELRQRHKDVVYDVAVPKQMKAAREARAELRVLRTSLEKRRVEIKAPALERCRLIDAEAKRITSEITQLEDPIDEQIKKEEHRVEQERLAKIEAERQRVQGINAKIDAIRALPASLVGKPSVIIRGQLSKLQDQAPSETDFAELLATAQDAHTAAVARIEQQLQGQIEHEAEQKRIQEERAELERLRAEADARRIADEKRIAEERAEQERQDRERREREEAEHRARLEQEARERAEREAQERKEREAREAEERRAREAQEAEARRIWEDQQRAIQEAETIRRAEEEARLQAERERLAEEQRQFEERQAEQRRKDAVARAQAEAERRANLTLRGAAQAVVEHFQGQNIAVVEDLSAALANEASAPAMKRQAAPASRTPRRAVGE